MFQERAIGKEKFHKYKEQYAVTGPVRTKQNYCCVAKNLST